MYVCAYLKYQRKKIAQAMGYFIITQPPSGGTQNHIQKQMSIKENVCLTWEVFMGSKHGHRKRKMC